MNNINKNLILFACLLMIFSKINAKEVGKEKALKVAENFIKNETKTNIYTTKYQVINNPNCNQECVMHIFSGENSYIIIAGDDRIYPVLAYSTESAFPDKGKVESMDWWIENSVKAISAECKLKSTVDKRITEAWEFYTSKTKSGSYIQNTKGVSPFLITTWNQDAGYNYFCPAHQAGPDGKCYAGCVATAMAQVMKYYNYPAVGKNNYLFHHQAFGDLTVDFSQSVYDWQHMGISTSANDPDTLRRNAIAKLIYDCGVSVDMYYTPSGSSSYLYKTQETLFNFFKYKRYISYAERANYTDEVWRNMMMENLDMHYPILYGGQANSGGHAWVCDGYQNTNYFHFNWGWSGYGNGFFYLNNLHSGNGDFNYGQDMVFNIVPDSSIFPLCNNSKKYTSQTYTFHDGSFTDNYLNNTNCQWLIKPDSGVAIKLDFLTFNTEQNNDILTIYDGETTSAPILGSYSGNYTIGNLPASLYSSSGSMLLVFVTNSTITNLGWKVKYTTDNVGISEKKEEKSLQIYPNPAHNQLNIRSKNSFNGTVRFSIFNSLGMEVLNTERTIDESMQNESIDISTLKQGVYLLNAESEKGEFHIKFIVE